MIFINDIPHPIKAIGVSEWMSDWTRVLMSHQQLGSTERDLGLKAYQKDQRIGG